MVADVGARRTRVALADLGGTILREFVRPTLDAGSAYDTLRALVLEATAEAEGRTLPVSSLVVGLPAIIDSDTGVAYGSPWDFGGSGLVHRLAQDVRIPIAVENEANLSALAHAWRGLGRGLRNFAVLSIGSGVGGAVFANGQLVRGRHNAGGEVGFLELSPDALHRPVIEPKPTLERPPWCRGDRRPVPAATWPSPSRSRRCYARTSIRRWFWPRPRPVHGWGQRAMEETLDLIAFAIIAVSAVVDPELVILDGGVGRSLGPYAGNIEERVHRRVAFTPRRPCVRAGLQLDGHRRRCGRARVRPSAAGAVGGPPPPDGALARGEELCLIEPTLEGARGDATSLNPRALGPSDGPGGVVRAGMEETGQMTTRFRYRLVGLALIALMVVAACSSSSRAELDERVERSSTSRRRAGHPARAVHEAGRLQRR